MTARALQVRAGMRYQFTNWDLEFEWRLENWAAETQLSATPTANGIGWYNQLGDPANADTSVELGNMGDGRTYQSAQSFHLGTDIWLVPNGVALRLGGSMEFSPTTQPDAILYPGPRYGVGAGFSFADRGYSVDVGYLHLFTQRHRDRQRAAAREERRSDRSRVGARRRDGSEQRHLHHQRRVLWDGRACRRGDNAQPPSAAKGLVSGLVAWQQRASAEAASKRFKRGFPQSGLGHPKRRSMDFAWTIRSAIGEVLMRGTRMVKRLTEAQTEELRQILIEERDRLLLSGQADLEEAKAGGERVVGDDVDQSNEDGALALAARFRARDRRLLRKVDYALERMERGEYDLCEITGDPIGYERLKFWPVTTLSIAAKEEAERHESEYIED